MSEDFIQLIMAGEERGLEILKADYNGRIKYIVSGILKNQNDIDECINDVYLTVWEKIQLYNPQKSSFATWISVVSRNKAINYLKKHNNNSVTLNEDIYSGSQSLEADVENKEQLIRVLNFVGTLSSADINLFYRKFYYLQSSTQIALETGKTERAIEGKLYRLRKKLKKEFGGEFL